MLENPIVFTLSAANRTILAILTSLTTFLCSAPWFLRWMKQKMYCQPISTSSPKTHQKKQTTPTMGGLWIFLHLTISTLLFSDWQNRKLWVALGTSLLFGAVGWIDDWTKISDRTNRGIPAKTKFLWLLLVAILSLGCSYGWGMAAEERNLWIPFLRCTWPIEATTFFVLGGFALVGCSNAVNLSDGLDGLVTVPIIFLASLFIGWITPLLPTPAFAMDRAFSLIELLPLLGACIGSCLGFLWINAHPALCFMGDVGSLGLGGLLASLAILTRQTLALPIAGGLFVLEALSVIAQIGRYKYSGKRWFAMAPIHHHFEVCGMPETRIVVRAWIVSFCCSLIALWASHC